MYQKYVFSPGEHSKHDFFKEFKKIHIEIFLFLLDMHNVYLQKVQKVDFHQESVDNELSLSVFKNNVP